VLALGGLQRPNYNLKQGNATLVDAVRGEFDSQSMVSSGRNRHKMFDQTKSACRQDLQVGRLSQSFESSK